MNAPLFFAVCCASPGALCLSLDSVPSARDGDSPEHVDMINIVAPIRMCHTVCCMHYERVDMAAQNNAFFHQGLYWLPETSR